MPILGLFWGNFGPPGTNFGDVPNSLIGPTRFDWMSLGGKCITIVLIGIETPLPVPGAVVLEWSFFAPKIIRRIGVRTDKIRHGHDLGVVKPIKS